MVINSVNILSKYILPDISTVLMETERTQRIGSHEYFSGINQLVFNENLEFYLFQTMFSLLQHYLRHGDQEIPGYGIYCRWQQVKQLHVFKDQMAIVRVTFIWCSGFLYISGRTHLFCISGKNLFVIFIFFLNKVSERLHCTAILSYVGRDFHLSAVMIDLDAHLLWNRTSRTSLKAKWIQIKVFHSRERF